MLHQTINIDRHQHFILACSAGSDSMAIADFYKRGNKSFTVAYFNHITPQANKMQDFLASWCTTNKTPFVAGTLSSDKDPSQSMEEYWRINRYEWLLSHKLPVVTAHNLDDAVETWVFSSLHGQSKLMPSQNGMVYRPFMVNEKSQLTDWCCRHNVPWIEDKSNKDIHFPRNRIRHIIIPECLKINPGLKKVIKKKILCETKSLITSKSLRASLTPRVIKEAF